MNNEQPRKPMQDILIPHNELARRASLPPVTPVAALQPSVPPTVPPITSPAFRTPPIDTSSGSRIAGSPFFERGAAPAPVKIKKNRTRFIIWSLVVFAVCGLALAIAQYFSSAIVVVTPVRKVVHLDNEFLVPKTASSTDLIFDFTSFTEDLMKEIPATAEKELQKKASGTVVLYNAFSAAPQRLIINTRLEAPDHKIFKIDSSVVVPGATMSKSGSVITPGSVEVVAYADAPGKEYNIGLSDFTIPGFKGSPRYTKFTARSKPDSPIQGGFLGSVKIPEDSAIATAQNELKEELKKIVATKARAQIPKESIFFPGSMIVRFEEIPVALGKESTTKISMRALVSVFFFDEKLLAEKITRILLPEGGPAGLSLKNTTGVSFTFVDPVDNIIPSDLTRVKFKLSGDVALAGDVDAKKLSSLLAGTAKKNFDSIIKQQTSIEKANLTIRPMWNVKLPTDENKITVKIDDKSASSN